MILGGAKPPARVKDHCWVAIRDIFNGCDSYECAACGEISNAATRPPAACHGPPAPEPEPIRPPPTVVPPTKETKMTMPEKKESHLRTELTEVGSYLADIGKNAAGMAAATAAAVALTEVAREIAGPERWPAWLDNPRPARFVRFGVASVVLVGARCFPFKGSDKVGSFAEYALEGAANAIAQDVAELIAPHTRRLVALAGGSTRRKLTP